MYKIYRFPLNLIVQAFLFEQSNFSELHNCHLEQYILLFSSKGHIMLTYIIESEYKNIYLLLECSNYTVYF